MTRLLACLLALALPAAVSAAGDAALEPYAVVAASPATASVYIATVTLSSAPFVRKGGGYAAAYSARVFPYFPLSEKGRIWIRLSDDDLRRISRGEPVDFTGQAVSDSGNVRRVQGRATPTGPSSGGLRVRIYVSRRISLSFQSSYEIPALKGRPR